MAWFRPLGVLALLLGLLMTLASCGQSTSTLPDTTGIQGPANSGAIPSIWDLDDYRSTSLLGGDDPSMTRLGKDYLENLVRNGTVDGDNIVLDSGAGDGEATAWAVYRFEGLTGKRPTALNVLATVGGLEQKYYVGLANYTEGNWEWFGPSHLPEFQIDLHESYERYVTALGNMYFLVICEGGDVVTHHKSVLSFAQGDGEVLPGAPRELQASDGTFADKVLVTWHAGEGATSYDVYRRLDGGNSEFEKIGTTEGLEFADTTAEAGHVYIYKAKSHNEAGYSGFSNSDHGFRGDLPDGGDCPTELWASDGSYTDKVRLEWHGSAGTVYKIWRKQDGMGEFDLIATTDDVSYNDTTAAVGVTYLYKVSTVREGEHCYSNMDSGYRADGNGDDACPREMVATDGTYADKVRLEWYGHAGSVYRIYRRVKESDEQYSQIGVTNDLSFNDTEAVANVVYTYKVVLTVEDQEMCAAEDHGFASGNTELEDCPHGLVATDGTYLDKVRLEWGGNSALGYDIYRKVDGGTEFTHLAFVTGLSYNDYSAQQGAAYIYKVGLEQPDGFCWSNTDAGWLHEEQQQEDCPSELSASDGTWESGVHLEWYGNAAASYDVWRDNGNGEGWAIINTTLEGLAYLDETAELGVTYSYKVFLHEGDCHSNIDSGYRGEQP